MKRYGCTYRFVLLRQSALFRCASPCRRSQSFLCQVSRVLYIDLKGHYLELGPCLPMGWVGEGGLELWYLTCYCKMKMTGETRVENGWVREAGWGVERGEQAEGGRKEDSVSSRSSPREKMMFRKRPSENRKGNKRREHSIRWGENESPGGRQMNSHITLL